LGIPASLKLCSAATKRSRSLYFFLYCRPNLFADASIGGLRVQATRTQSLLSPEVGTHRVRHYNLNFRCRELFPAGGEILDLMSSWVSHLPPEIEYRRVIGLGMNEVELRRNERLDYYIVQNLNINPRLPFGEAEFDGCGICVSIDYLTRPIEVLREVGRVLKVGSPTIISFSNRCFPSKAVAIWHQLDDRGHMRLVERYLKEAGNFDNIRSLDRSPRRMFSDPLYAVIGESARETGQ
jgi:SAM-dependent methyltransferase